MYLVRSQKPIPRRLAIVSRRSAASLRRCSFPCGSCHVSLRKLSNGSLPGTATLLVRRSDGLDWAVLFNQRQNGGKLNDGAIDPALHRAAAEVKDWPKEDLFPQFRD